jgi:hypothetical protein
MVGRTAAQGRIPALKRTLFTSHGENARRIGRFEREPAPSGALRAEGSHIPRRVSAFSEM